MMTPAQRARIAQMAPVTADELAHIRSVHVARIAAAHGRSIRAAGIRRGEGAPYRLVSLGAWLYAQGFRDKPSAGEHYFGLGFEEDGDFCAYAQLAQHCEPSVEAGAVVAEEILAMVPLMAEAA